MYVLMYLFMYLCTYVLMYVLMYLWIWEIPTFLFWLAMASLGKYSNIKNQITVRKKLFRGYKIRPTATFWAAALKGDEVL